MRVVHLCTFTGDGGGAARASYRLHRTLKDRGVHSSVLTMFSTARDPDVHVVGTAGLQWRARRAVGTRLERLVHRYARPAPGAVFTSGLASPLNIARHPEVTAADAIVLYWVGGGFLSSPAIGQLLRLGKPVVWRLSDMWAFTGGCHYSAGCERYRASCGSCPQLRSSTDLDLSRLVWRQKRASWRPERLTVVCPSTWMASCVRASSLLGSADVRVIHTGVDVDRYRPFDRATARDILGIPRDRPVVLTGGHEIFVGNDRKGGQYLLDALEVVKRTVPDVHLAIFGTSHSPPGFSCTALGAVHDERMLALAYAAADLFVSTSLEDNLPNTVLEAMSCGLPVVAFDIEGVRDAVLPGETGLLSSARDTAALAANLTACLRDAAARQSMSGRARQRVLTTFDAVKQAGAYAALLDELCSRSPRQFSAAPA